MSIRSRLHSVVAALILAAAPAALTAQWLDYPTSGVPRTADGKPNFSAPAPRTADGKPDLSGMWGWVTIGPPCGSKCGSAVSALVGGVGQETQGRAGSRVYCMPVNLD